MIIPKSDKSIGYQFSIEKGGPGSGPKPHDGASRSYESFRDKIEGTHRGIDIDVKKCNNKIKTLKSQIKTVSEQLKFPDKLKSQIKTYESKLTDIGNIKSALDVKIAESKARTEALKVRLAALRKKSVESDLELDFTNHLKVVESLLQQIVRLNIALDNMIIEVKALQE